MKLLQKHIHNVCQNISSRMEMSAIAGHGTNIGTARELIVSQLLMSNLPSNVCVSTGEAFDSEDNRSGQLDIIIHSSTAPKLTLEGNITVVPVDSIICTIESKSNLTTGSMESGKSHLKIALDSCKKLKSLNRINSIGIDKDYLKEKGLHDHITPSDYIDGMRLALQKTPYMIFAYDGPSPENLIEKLREYQNINNLSLDEMPDVITVLSKNYCITNNNGWIFKKAAGGVDWSRLGTDNSTLLGMYLYLLKLIEAETFRLKFFPVAQYLAKYSSL